METRRVGLFVGDRIHGQIGWNAELSVRYSCHWQMNAISDMICHPEKVWINLWTKQRCPNDCELLSNGIDERNDSRFLTSPNSWTEEEMVLVFGNWCKHHSLSWFFGVFGDAKLTGKRLFEIPFYRMNQCDGPVS
jgi:hypothetical protein